MAKGTSLTYSLLILSIKIGCKIDHRCHDHDHRSGRHIGKIRNDQSHDSGKKTKDHGIEVIFLHVFRYIPAGCRWQDQKGIDEQNTDPLDRQCHNERNDNISSTRRTEILRLFAKDAWMLIAFNLLMAKHQNTRVTAKIRIR